MNAITVYVYNLFGAWRAECGSCGSYGDSYMHGTEKVGGAKGRNTIAEALDSLENNQHTINDKYKECKHEYGSYKPRVTCCIDYRDIQHIKENVRNDGCEQFPRILVDNKYYLEVRNAPKLTHEWSAYSYVRHMQRQNEVPGIEMTMDEAHGRPRYVQELADEYGQVNITKGGRTVAIVHALEKEPIQEDTKTITAKAELQQSIKDCIDKIETATAKHTKYLKYYIYGAWLFVAALLLCGLLYGIQRAGGGKAFIQKLETACDYKICL